MARSVARACFAMLAALLLSRLVLLLLAARPDNRGVSVIRTLSDWLVWPMAWIDLLQPVYGARFERGTVLELCVCLLVLWWMQRRTPA